MGNDAIAPVRPNPVRTTPNQQTAPVKKVSPPPCDPNVEKAAIDFILSFKSTSPERAKYIWQLVKKYSDKYKINPLFVLCIMAKESSFKEGAVSSTQDVGLMQLSKGALTDISKRLKRNIDPRKIEDNVLAGVYYLAVFCKAGRGSEIYGTVRYHAGPYVNVSQALNRPHVANYACNIYYTLKALERGEVQAAALNISKKFSTTEVAMLIDLARKGQPQKSKSA
jgi:hypothetical protein